ncbi:DUF1799 domain-containing protein [Curvibacter sp. HBC28]|uniref:DUF1799 domain-containing protein n=1 Tax=Curvibacter microcysteis TaxID=3026419 RepID=A0ABT5MCJ4_9BURK|nr:DUF1799 domain-containing protein [Curvibacter sp. HBC28]MDD0814287.1 DUF1799 domain-containing protein [Curvibacter sp. HBC28]
MFEPDVTEAEARAEGFELEDYVTEVIEVWPDNETPLQLFRQVGTRWRIPPMGGTPIGLEWAAIYPLMDRLGLADEAWNDLHEALMVMEQTAIETMQEFAPKPAK